MKARVIKTGEIIDVVPKINPNAVSAKEEIMSRTYRKHLLKFWSTKDSSRSYNKTFRRINKMCLKQNKDFKQMNEIVDPYDIQDVKCYWRLNTEKCTNWKYSKD